MAACRHAANALASVAIHVVPLSNVVMASTSTAPLPVETTPSVPPTHRNDAGHATYFLTNWVPGS